MTISGIEWSNVTAEELTSSPKEALAFTNAENVTNNIWLADELSPNWEQIIVLISFSLLWLCKEPLYNSLRPSLVHFWVFTLYPLLLPHTDLLSDPVGSLEGALATFQLTALFLISLPRLVRIAINRLIISTLLKTIDILTRSLASLRNGPEKSHLTPVCSNPPLVAESQHSEPGQVACSCPPPLISFVGLQQLAAELDESLDKLSDQRYIIRVLRGEITALTNERDELLQYRTRFHEEEAGRRNDKALSEFIEGQMTQELRDTEAQLQTARNDLQLAILLNEPVPELDEDLPIITDEMEKADIITTHYDAIASLRQNLNEEYAAATNELETQHRTAVAALEARITALATENASFRANGIRKLIIEKHCSIPNLKATISSLRQRLDTADWERHSAHVRAERLSQRIQEDMENAGKEKCCHIADLELDLRTRQVLESERLEREVMNREHEKRLNEEKAERAWLEVVAGRDIEEIREQGREYIRMIDMIRSSGLEGTEQLEDMFRDYPRFRRMVEDSGIEEWGELRRLFSWHRQMKEAIGAVTSSSS